MNTPNVTRDEDYSGLMAVLAGSSPVKRPLLADSVEKVGFLKLPED